MTDAERIYAATAAIESWDPRDGINESDEVYRAREAMKINLAGLTDLRDGRNGFRESDEAVRQARAFIDRCITGETDMSGPPKPGTTDVQTSSAIRKNMAARP